MIYFRFVFVGNIAFHASEDELRAACELIGPLRSLRLAADPATNKRKGHAFVEYADDETARSACRNLHGHFLRGRELRVALADRRRGVRRVGDHEPVGMEDAVHAASLVVNGRPLESVTRYLASRSRRDLRKMVSETTEVMKQRVPGLDTVMEQAQHLLDMFAANEEEQARKKMKRANDKEQHAKLRKVVGVDGGIVKAAPRIGELRAACELIGPVRSLRLAADPATNKRRGHAFVEYADDETARSACRNLHGHFLRGRELLVALADRRRGARRVGDHEPVGLEDAVHAASLVVTGRPLESVTRYLASRSRLQLRKMVSETTEVMKQRVPGLDTVMEQAQHLLDMFAADEEEQARKKMKRASDEEHHAKRSKVVGVDGGVVKAPLRILKPQNLGLTRWALLARAAHESPNSIPLPSPSSSFASTSGPARKGPDCPCRGRRGERRRRRLEGGSYPMDSLQNSYGSCLKHKLVDDCLSKDFKYRRVEEDNVSPNLESIPLSSSHTQSCCIQPNLAKDCVNYLKSGVPTQVVFYRQGAWCDFPQKIMESLVDGFKTDKSSAVVVMDGQPLLVDFLSMTMVNLKTRKQQSVSWLDGTGKWFFPSTFFDKQVDQPVKLNMGTEGSGPDITEGMVPKAPNERFQTSPSVLQNSCITDILRKKIVPVERGSEIFQFVQNLFLSGMGSFAAPKNILHIHQYFPEDAVEQCRLEAFERQVLLTRKKIGDANVRYGWLGSRKQDIVGVLINGFVSTRSTRHNSDMCTGVYLSPKNRAFTTVGLCDVDEKGVQYMFLCRAILGNMGTIEPVSQEEFLSIYDSGVDNSLDPNYYVIWPSKLGTHISLEYLISFRLTPEIQDYLLHLKGFWLCPTPKEVDLSTLQPVVCESDNGPTSPWISFRVLFETLPYCVSSLARELLFHHYQEMKDNKITREEMPSEWYKSHGELACYPSSIKLDNISNSTTNMNSASTRASYDSQAPSVQPQKYEPVDSTDGDLTVVSVALKGQHFSISSVCYESSSSHCTRSQDSAARMTPDDTLVRRALISESVNCCDSVGPSLESHGHTPLAQSFDSEGHVSLVSRSTFGNSAASLCSSSPSMTTEAQVSVAQSRVYENSSLDAKSIVAPTSSVAPQVHAPSMVPQNCARMSAIPHRCLPRSMAPTSVF
uniref:Poly [ADP-ribose] polymerase n=1 Tax=Leersia perrieri TaxID=77586 RepID=A0A0D9WNW0_9ORYZ